MADIFYVDTVTIWNRYVDGIWEKEIWMPTLIENARLLVSRGNNIQNSGNSSADSARLHISDIESNPQKPYMDPSEWNALTQSEKGEYFTLESESCSFFVRGDTTKVDASEKDNFFEYMKKTYPDCFKITSIDRFEIIPHFEVWGK